MLPLVVGWTPEISDVAMLRGFIIGVPLAAFCVMFLAAVRELEEWHRRRGD